jgi:hypothetical protein
MTSKRVLPTLALSGVIALATAGTGATTTASAATQEVVQENVSQNWAGYVVGTSDGQNFSSVSGSWVEPSATCTSGDGHAAFWVGLGGSGQSNSLEQTGTEVDCTGSGQATQFAWYELVPSAPVKLDLAIHSGDHISARVTVNGTNVTVALSDSTTGASATRALQMSDPDTSSAEWIAEAPSQCDQTLQSCQPLDLTDFGTVNFSDATATAGGHTGTISDSAWSPEAVELGGNDAAGAQPSSTNAAGSSFSVSYTANSADAGGSADAGSGEGAYPGYGGGGYGGGYPAGYGYGGGYGGYGGYGAYSYGGPGAYGYGY